ncbi:kinase-like domain-containing protein [Gilbertella persicaria]|uniref:kinase-like domain-containing protein n=1 Tax=Gilbertella persicaria TaxID=101096 RepID=UPI002220DE77|nr:kinase-like domain-containing protein [Gilbertella persicaria]KAI8068159.1 kinase-like domain-containing protein [Gilbertella persicaria]
MFDIFSVTKDKDEKIKQQVNAYIERNPNEFLNPVRDNAAQDIASCSSLETCWSSLLTLNKSRFMNGWKPSCHQYDSLYDQLFDHYFHHYSNEIQQFVEKHSHLTWFVPKWFEHCQPLPSGRMGQVYLTTYHYKKLMVRELNMCMITHEIDQIYNLPNELLGITATRRKGQHHHSLAFVYLAAQTSLEHLIPQVDQWSFQKIFRTALAIASVVRDAKLVHPNLQPHNLLLFQKWSLVDNWSMATTMSPYYGRYPYIAPEGTLTSSSNVYSLGVILWQLASGIVFPQFNLVSPEIYRMLPVTEIDPAYTQLVRACLSKSSENRPSLDQVCDTLLHILLSEMSRPCHDKQLHAYSVKQRQLAAAKYLAGCQGSSLDIQELLVGASMSKRMMFQVTVSYERYKKPTTTTAIIPKQEKQNRTHPTYHDTHACHYVYSNDLSDLIQMGSVA